MDTYRLYQNVVAAGTLYTLAMTTEVCETLGLATVPREVPPGWRPVTEIAGLPEDFINWSASRRHRIEDTLDVLTDQYVKDHGHLPSERGRHGLGRWAAQETRPAKKPKPLAPLLAWWRASAILRFCQQLIDGLLDRCRAAGAAIRPRVDPAVDVTLAAAVDVAAVVFTVREKFSRCHILAEARRHLLEALRGREYTRGLDDYICARTRY
ncbi:relaxase domain-containing protein [Streptomyces sp. NPDC005426]|uniref:relaxase domain-containing protein n=1 Tax=Streptomyces sp. NPDC005426 TaxID=3155344 RepID=UPI0033A69FB2